MTTQTVSFRPQQSFQHTVREIAVNREDPCEIVRELISNAVDAAATEVMVIPYVERKGLVFFDNGVGLSQSASDLKNGVVPYVAFFSIGKTTKVRGQSIGYKCQGAKLCFASSRITVITRCKGEAGWRWIKIEDPKNNLSENSDITPQSTSEPWNIVETKIFTNPDDRTLAILNQLNRKFFEEQFQTGTLIVVEEFDAADYEKYFSVSNPEKSYLYNYIRYSTSHGDVRSIDFKDSGFSAPDTNAVRTHLKSKPLSLRLLMDPEGDWAFKHIPPGYPYLPVSDDDLKVASPNEVSRLRDGRFCGRFATVIDHGGRKYSLVLAIDARRRALDGYKELGRQSSSGCGITLSSQRGTFLSAHGIKVCRHDQLFDSPVLKDYEVLRDNNEHHLFFIDGPIELVTNRNAAAPSTLQLFADKTFVEKIKAFLDDVFHKRPRGVIFRELLQRLTSERTHQREDHYLKMMNQVKASLPSRGQFQVKNVPQLTGKWFFEPALGEENFVGALFTLFAHLVDNKHQLSKYWHRPLTFKAYGIDAVSCSNEQNIDESLEYVEYKHTFSAEVEFNHPFSITNTIICWDFGKAAKGTALADSYDYIAKIKEDTKEKGNHIGFTVGDIRLRNGLHETGNEIAVLSLKRLIAATFDLEIREAVPKSK